MAIPILELNLASPPTLWRQHHQILGWAALGAGSLTLAVSILVSVLAYREASLAGRNAILKTDESMEVIRKQEDIKNRLKDVDVEKELPVWRLAERILIERSLPWSRLTAELERSMVQDIRLTRIQRTRNTAQAVELKITGEAKSRAAEEDFVTSLHQNAFFSQVVLERESDRPGGGVDFEFTLSISLTPPAFKPLPKYGPVRSKQAPPLPGPFTPGKAAPGQVAPGQVAPGSLKTGPLASSPPVPPAQQPPVRRPMAVSRPGTAPEGVKEPRP